MAEWNDNVKHPKSSINNGQQYTKDDNVTLESLNNTIENSFYAVRVAENAQSATNNAVSYNAQTPLATEQIQAQKNLGIDQTIAFAESERQKSKNLFNINKLSFNYVPGSYSINYNTGTITFVDSGANSTSDLRLKDFTDLKAGKTYRLSYAYTGTPSNLFIYLNGSDNSWLNGDTHTITQAELDSGIHMYGSPTGTVTLSDIIMVEVGVDIDYQPYNGQISHSGDKEIEFARNEYEKSKNLIPFPYYDGTSQISNGITFTVNKDQSILVSGSIVDHNSNAVMWLAWDMPLKAGTYRISDSGQGNDLSVVVWIGNNYYQKDFNNGIFTLSSDTTAKIYLQVAKGSTKTYNDTVKFMLCEGTDTDWQPYNGAIVHKSEVEPILIYDLDTKNTIGGTAYTNGIGDGSSAIYTINNIDLTPYKYMYVYQRMFGEIQKIFVDLTKTVEAGGYCGGQVTMSYNIDALDCFLVKVPTTKDSITVDARYIRLSDMSIQSTPVNIYRMEGYK